MATAIIGVDAASARWNLVHRIAFRLVFCYLIFYCTRPFMVVSGVCSWIAIHIFHLTGERTTTSRQAAAILRSRISKWDSREAAAFR